MLDPIDPIVALLVVLGLGAWCVSAPRLITAAARCHEQLTCQHQREASFLASNIPTGDHW